MNLIKFAIIRNDRNKQVSLIFKGVAETRANLNFAS
jgi:hypothetical protein